MEKNTVNKLIVIDSREKAKAIKKIVSEFDKQNIKYISSKLYVGDYMSYDKPRFVIDRKQNLTELCGNICQQHIRFRNELRNAQENNIKLIFLCEHGGNIKTLDDVAAWINPRRFVRKKDYTTGKWHTIETKAIKGEVLHKILLTLQERYGCQFLFCDKSETGKKIIELLGVKYEQ